MPTKAFDTLEDAIIELKKLVKSSGLTPDQRSIRKIYPARFDQPAINNIADQVSKGLPFTDKQQELAIKLVTKYRRQWKKLGYDVSNISQDTPLRHPIRTDVDRSREVYVENNRILLKFPYNPKIIGHLAGYGEFSKGKLFWDKDNKVWSVSITPDNILWIQKFAKDHKFETKESFNNLHEQLDGAYDFKSIQLDIQDKQLILRDAPATMLEWIHKHIGRIEMKNFVKLVSYSHILAYTLSDDVVQYAIRNYPNSYRQILNRESFINSNVESISDMLLKVKQLDFNNIAFFIVDTDDLEPFCKRIEVMLPDYNILTVIPDKADHSSKSLKSWSHSPYKTKEAIVTNKVLVNQSDLIISFAGFMAGPARRDWFGNANKLLYYCNDIDGKIKKKIKKHESNFSNKR